MDDLRKIRLITWTGMVLGISISVGLLLLGYVQTAEWAALGGVLGIGNFFLIQLLVRGLLSTAPSHGKAKLFVVYFVKMIALVCLVGLTCMYFPIEPVGFMIGFSFILAAVFLVGFFFLIKGARLSKN